MTHHFRCDEVLCTKIFDNEQDLLNHLQDPNKHSNSFAKTTADIARQCFLIQKNILTASTSTVETQTTCSTSSNEVSDNYLIGWARFVRKSSRFSNKQKDFVKQIYQEGEEAGSSKKSAEYIAALMKSATYSHVFSSKEYLSVSQINGLLTRFGQNICC